MNWLAVGMLTDLVMAEMNGIVLDTELEYAFTRRDRSQKLVGSSSSIGYCWENTGTDT